MPLTRRTLGALLIGTGTCILASTAVARLLAQPAVSQEQAPNRREIAVAARDFQFSPNRIEVSADDLVKVTIQSDDVAYSFTIDEYRVSKRIPAGTSMTFEFRADRAGTFDFYSNLTSDSRHRGMRGQLVVRPR